MKKGRNEIITKGLKKIPVYDWMYRDLKLQGKELLVYAALYGMKDKKILLTDAPVIYGYMKTDRSSFFRVRAALVKKGLIDVTEDEGEKYFYVSEPDLSHSEDSSDEVTESVADIEAELEAELDLKPELESEREIIPQTGTAATHETPQETSEIRDTPQEESPVQLDLLGTLFESSDKNVGVPEKTGKAAKAVEPCPTPVDNIARGACGNKKTPDSVPAEPDAQPSVEPEDPAKTESDVITKERFCEEMGIEYDGTENTEGLDWGILLKEYSLSEYLRNLPIAHILKKIPFNYEAIKNGDYSDERRAEKAKGKSEAAEKTSSN